MSQDKKYQGLDAYIKFNYEDKELLLQSESFWTGDTPIGINESFWTVEHFKERCIEHIKENFENFIKIEIYEQENEEYIDLNKESDNER